MALFQFTPVAGPSVGAGAFTLPSIQDGDSRSIELLTDEMSHMSGTPGMYDGQGTDATDSGAGQMDVTFYLSNNWLLSRSYSADIPGREAAIKDFTRAVAMGGLGTLSDRYFDTGAIARTSTTKARCTAMRVMRSASETWTITVTFEAPSGYWNYWDGTLLLFC